MMGAVNFFFFFFEMLLRHVREQLDLSLLHLHMFIRIFNGDNDRRTKRRHLQKKTTTSSGITNDCPGDPIVDFLPSRGPDKVIPPADVSPVVRTLESQHSALSNICIDM